MDYEYFSSVWWFWMIFAYELTGKNYTDPGLHNVTTESSLVLNCSQQYIHNPARAG